MHIKIKNKFLYINNYKVKCALGKRGIKKKVKEGDLVTPKGKFKIKYILYRKDRISKLKTKIKKIAIERNMGWCDDPSSKSYNKLIRFPFNFSAEKLYKSENIYDIVFVLDYNFKPIRKNKGSAIFIHIAKKNYSKTAGCIAVKKKDIKEIAKLISNRSIVDIN